MLLKRLPNLLKVMLPLANTNVFGVFYKTDVTPENKLNHTVLQVQCCHG